MSSRTAPQRRTGRPGRHRVSTALPGLGLASLGALAASLLARVSSATSPLVLAVGFGLAAGSLGLAPTVAGPGLQLVAKRCLRAGVVLLGFRLAIGDIAELGAVGLVAVVSVVTLTFTGTRWLAARLKLSPGVGLLVATGFSICGVSAIAAMEGAADADEEDVALGVALVTLCGTLAILVLPLLGSWMGLGARPYGVWVGASVHDVAQVVAAASPLGPAAVTGAVTVKLSRVVLLAPLVAAVSLTRRGDHSTRSDTGDQATPDRSKRPTPVPLFMLGFLASAGLRSAGVVPSLALDVIRVSEGLLLTAAMFAVGTSVQLTRLRQVGARPLALGLLSWALIASASLAATHLAFS